VRIASITSAMVATHGVRVVVAVAHIDVAIGHNLLRREAVVVWVRVRAPLGDVHVPLLVTGLLREVQAVAIQVLL
jgi:LEA14-like dessication related protein